MSSNELWCRSNPTQAAVINNIKILALSAAKTSDKEYLGWNINNTEFIL